MFGCFQITGKIVVFTINGFSELISGNENEKKCVECGEHLSFLEISKEQVVSLAEISREIDWPSHVNTKEEYQVILAEGEIIRDYVVTEDAGINFLQEMNEELKSKTLLCFGCFYKETQDLSLCLNASLRERCEAEPDELSELPVPVENGEIEELRQEVDTLLSYPDEWEQAVDGV